MSFKSLVAKLMKEGKSRESAEKIAGSVANAKMHGAGSGPTAAQKARSAGKQMKSPAKRAMKSNQDGGGKSSTEAADQLKKLGSPAKKMDHYEDKEASMDDYSHEKKLGADGRYELEHGKKADAENDFAHAHALKKDAHYDHMNRKSFATQFNDKSPMKRFQDFDQMDSRNAKATAGESPATQKMFGSEELYKENKSYDDAFKAFEDSSKTWLKDVDKVIEGDTTAGNYPRPTPPKMSDHFSGMRDEDESVTKQYKSPAKKYGAMKGDQSATRSDYANFKDTDPGYHGHDGSSHGDQSATRSDYRSRMTRNSK